MDQENIDSILEYLRRRWQDLVEESGKSQAVFIATDKKAVIFLSDFAQFKADVEKRGLTVPELTPGLTVEVINEAEAKVLREARCYCTKCVTKRLRETREAKAAVTMH